jgi:RNA polymerase sigma factor (sigma-70 family)
VSVLKGGQLESTTLLLQRCADGSLYDRNELHRRIFSRIQLLTRKQLPRFGKVTRYCDAEDVQQDVHLRLDRALQHDPPANSPALGALISMIIPQVLIDLHRKSARRPLVLENQLQSPASGSVVGLESIEHGTGTDDPQRLAQWTEFHDRVLRLPEPQGTVFRLVWYYDTKREEVARIACVTKKSVYNYYRAAWAQLSAYAPIS